MPDRRDVSAILRDAARTFEQRNEVYGDAWVLQARVLEMLFPDGIETDRPGDWEVIELLISAIAKLVRFVKSNCTHIDSAHDAAVFWAMIEESLRHHQEEKA